MEAVLIPALLYLPGHILGAILARKDDGWAELFLLRVAAAAAVSGPALVVLALIGWFTMPAIVSSFVVCAAIAFTLTRLRNGARRTCASPSGWDLGALGLVVGAFALYAHPAEYVLKDRDPGVYTVVAMKLARTGELLTRDPLVGAVASFHQFEYGAKHPGLFVHGNDLVVPQFFPGSFAWMGLGNLVGGVWGGLYVVPVFGALAVGMACMLGRELFGRWAGLAGAALLAVGYTQVWWARYPSSEVITQFFILAGLWLAARYVGDGGAGTGVLTGALFGGAMLVRVDAVLATLVVPLLIGHHALLGRPLKWWSSICAPLLLLGGATMLYALTIGERYLDLIYDLHVPDQALQFAPHLLGTTLLVAGVLWGLRRRWSEKLRRLLAPYGQSVAFLTALSILGLALWAYFVLPEPWEGLPEFWGGTAGPRAEFNAYDRQVAVRMVWFLTPAVAVLGMAGFAVAAYRLDEGRAFFLGAVLAFGVAYIALPNVAPDLPWATRRFVPIVFPGLCILAGYAAAEAGRALRRVWGMPVGVTCAVTLVVLALAWSILVAWPIYGVRELAGAVEGFERLEEAIPDSQVVYVELPADDYAATLDYLYGRQILSYDREQFRQELSDLEDVGLLDDAVYVMVEGKPKPIFPGLQLREVGREEISFSRLEDGFGEVPQDTYEERQGFRIYKLEQA